MANQTGDLMRADGADELTDLTAFTEALRAAITTRHRLDHGGAPVTVAGSGAPGWATLVDLGVTGLGIAESDGGAAAGLREKSIVLTEASAHLLPAPYLATMCLGLPLLPQGHPLRVTIAGGQARLTVAWSGSTGPASLLDPKHSAVVVTGSTLTGTSRLVLDLRDCTDVLVLTSSGLFHVPVDGEGVTVSERSTVDQTRSLDDLVLDHAPAQLVLQGPALESALAAARLSLRVGAAAEAVGVADRCLHLSLDHARVREAFGRPIGGYQAISHPLVEVYADVELARSAVLQAADLIDAGDPSGQTAAATAYVCATDAALAAAERAIQTLGGIGFTWEHVAHRLYKRALGLAQSAGSRSSQVDLVASTILD